ncbi:XkdX family protein [Cohnella sp. AR92]|nr:XkdX family protein [Cohnella sp. AR92]RUS42266.1 XkdX family protein [Cohnella sp. AR92]
MRYQWIKQFYDAGMAGYDANGIRVFVAAGWITAQQYESITGEPY